MQEDEPLVKVRRIVATQDIIIPARCQATATAHMLHNAQVACRSRLNMVLWKVSPSRQWNTYIVDESCCPCRWPRHRYRCSMAESGRSSYEKGHCWERFSPLVAKLFQQQQEVVSIRKSSGKWSMTCHPTLPTSREEKSASYSYGTERSSLPGIMTSGKRRWWNIRLTPETIGP